jgi:hypothetical protein
VLDSTRLARLDDHRIAHEPVGRFPYQDLIRLRSLLEALRDSDSLSGDRVRWPAISRPPAPLQLLTAALI